MSKREIILKTAAHLFPTQGFDATTTLQLAREAGVTEPLIYYHFPKDFMFELTKNELLICRLQR